jgi:neutral ceramidase
MAGSVLLAYKNMEEVKVGAAKGEVPETVYNRRPKRADGSVKMAFTLPPEVRATRRTEGDPQGSLRVTFTFPPEEEALAFGPIDPEMLVLRVEKTTGEMVGSIVNFACHPVSIYPHLPYSISADFPAYTAQVVEQMEGGTCLFVLGTAGDIVPIERGEVPRQRIGKALGGEALRRLQFAATSSDVTLAADKKSIEFPLKEAPESGQTAEGDKRQEHLTTEIQLLRIGNIYLLGLPGEILVELGLEIKKRAALENLFIVTLSNDTIGYVCHGQAYDEGGYESGTGTNLAKGAGEIMVREALDLIDQVRASR